MEFNEEKAREIIERYSLSPNTLNVWKSRKSIPSKYAKEDYQQPEEISSAGKIILDRIDELIKTNVLNFSVICEIVGIKRIQLADACKGKGRMNAEDIEKIRNEVNRSRLVILRAFRDDSQSPQELKSLFKNKTIKHYVVAEDDAWHKKMKYAIENEYKLYQEDYMRLKDTYIKASILMNI